MRMPLTLAVILAPALLTGCGKSRDPQESIRRYIKESMIQEDQTFEEVTWSGPKPVVVGKGVGWKLTETMQNLGAAHDESLVRVAEIVPDGLLCKQEARDHNGKVQSTYTREVKAGNGYQLFLVGLRVSGGARGHSQTAMRLANLDAVANCGGPVSASLMERREGTTVKQEGWEGAARPRTAKSGPGVTEVLFVLDTHNKVVFHLPGSYWEWYEKATAN